MIKKQKDPEHHYRKAKKWRKIFQICFKAAAFLTVIFFFLFILTYKFKLLPQTVMEPTEYAEGIIIIFVLGVKAKHFYHNQFHCTKCRKNKQKENFFKKVCDYCGSWCDAL